MEFEWEDVEDLEDRFIEAMGIMGRYIADSVDNSLSIFSSSGNAGGKVSVVGSFADDSRAYMGATLKHQDIMREMSRRFFSTTTYQLGLIHSATIEQGKSSDFLLQRVASRLNFIKDNLTLSALSGVAKIATSVYRITSGILFGRKDRRSSTQRIVDSIERLTNLVANGRAGPKRGFFSGGLTGVLGQGFKRGIGLGADRALQTEQKRARGEKTSFLDNLSQGLNKGRFSLLGKTESSRADAYRSNSDSEQVTLQSIRDILYDSTPIMVQLSNGTQIIDAIKESRTVSSTAANDIAPTTNVGFKQASGSGIATNNTQHVNVDNLDDPESSPLSEIQKQNKQQVNLSQLQNEHNARMDKHSSVLAKAANETSDSTHRSEQELKKIRKQVWYMSLLNGVIGAVKSLWAPIAGIATFFAAGKFKDGIKNAVAAGWGVLKDGFSNFVAKLKSLLFGDPKSAATNAAKNITDDGAAAGGSVLKKVLGDRVGGILGKAGGIISKAAPFLKAGPLSGIFGAGAQVIRPDSGDSRYGRDNLIKAGARGGGATVGTLIGGGLGSFLGPVGTFAGGALGGYLGDKFGKKIGSILTSDVSKAIGGYASSAVKMSYDAVFGSKDVSNRSRELKSSLDENSNTSSRLGDALETLNTSVDRLNKNVEKSSNQVGEAMYDFNPGISQNQSSHVSGDF